MNESGNDKEINKFLELESGDSVLCDLAPLGAHDGNSQPIYRFQPVDEVDRILIRLCLIENIAGNIFRRKRPGLEENDLAEVSFEAHFSAFISVVSHAVTVVELSVVDRKMFSSALAESRVPAISEKDAADIAKGVPGAADWDRAISKARVIQAITNRQDNRD